MVPKECAKDVAISASLFPNVAAGIAGQFIGIISDTLRNRITSHQSLLIIVFSTFLRKCYYRDNFCYEFPNHIMTLYSNGNVQEL